MTDNVMTFPLVGQLGVSRISYFCDLQKRSGLIIPLGTIAEISVASVRVLGLIARTELFDYEREAIGQLMRDQLSYPFAMLKNEFEWAWKETKSGEALRVLAQKYTESLFFSPPKFQQIKFEQRTLGEIAEQAKKKLRHGRDKEFLDLLTEVRSHSNPIPQEELARLAA